MFVGLGLLVVIALFTALIAPYFIDWSNYKEDFETQASRIVGQKVVVSGEANVRILPLPSISFSDLAVGENSDGGPMMTVSQFNANVELMPFLSGEIRIVDMSLNNPVFDLEFDESGKIAWTERQEPLVNPRQVKLDKLTLRNAEFHLKGLSPDRVISGTGIDANVSAQSLFGPWRITGAGNVDGQQSRFELATGQFSDDRSIRLKAVLARDDEPYDLKLDGSVSLKEEVLSWDGTFAIEPFESAEKLSAFADRPPLPVRVKGDFVLSPNRLLLPDYSVEIGSREDPFSLTGNGNAKLKGGLEFRLQIDGRQVDIGRIAQMRGGQPESVNTLETRIALFREVLNQVPVPGFKGEIDLEIPAIIAGDTFIRGVSAIVRPFGDGWEIVRLKSSLPGNTLIEAKGRLGKGDEFGFHGELLIASNQPSGFAAWAAGKVDPAIRRLSSAGLSANVTLTPSQIDLDQMELILDQNRLVGSVQRLAPAKGAEGVPAIIANLSGNEIRLEDLQAVGSLFSGESAISLENDFDISLKAEKLAAFDLNAKNVDTQFQYKGGALSVSRLSLEELLGVSIKSSGQITDFLANPRGNITFQVSADNFQMLADHLGERFGWNSILRAFASDASLSENSDLTVELDSRPSDDGSALDGSNRFIVQGLLSQTSINLRGRLKGSASDWKGGWADISLEASHENGEVLLKQLGLGDYGFAPLQQEMASPLTLNVESVGTASEGYSTIISMNNADTSLSANGSIKELFGGSSEYEFDVTLGSANIAPLVYSFGHTLPWLNPLFGDEAPFSSKFAFVSRQDGALKLEIEKGQIYGNQFSGSLERSNSDGNQTRWSGDLEVDHIAVDVLSELATSLKFRDELGSWVETEFSSRPLAEERASVNIKARTADVGLSVPAEDVSFILNADENSVIAQDITFAWNGANVSGNTRIGRNDRDVVLNAQFSGSDADSAALLNSLPFASVIQGKGSFSISLDSTGKSPKALVGSITGDGFVTMPEGTLLGIRSQGLNEILETADQEGFEISTASVAPLASAAFLQGETGFKDFNAPFSIRSGELKFTNIEILQAHEEDGAKLSGNLLYDLTEGDMEASVTLLPDVGREAVAGGTPEVVFIWNGIPELPEVSVNTGGLEGFLSIRAFEIEERRVETLQSNILEKQRFRYELLKSNARGRWLEEKRLEAERLAREEEERLAKEEAEKLAKEEAEREAQRLAAEAAAKAQREAEEAAQMAREKKERLRRKQEALREAEEQAEREALLEKQRQEQLEAQRKATEANNAPQPIAPPKQGFEVNELPAPNAKPKNDIFKNIEQLLFQQ